MELLDTTLREGEQCYGVLFSRETKVRIAELLDKIGVDFIEAGHPAAAPSIRDAAAAIARLDLRARRIGHARPDRSEIRLVRDLGLPWVGLFSGINGLSLDRYGASRAAVMERVLRSIRFAKDIGLSVRFTCEDASRTDPDALIELYSRAREAGADRISYADTVGIDTPERLTRLERLISGAVPFTALHFHFHDDNGRAFANAVAAAKLGAGCIDVSIKGIGERLGIVPLERMLAWSGSPGAGGRCGGADREGTLRSALSLVDASIDRRRYLRRRFAHKSGIHIHGIARDPSCYEHAAPEAWGCRRRIVLSKMIGRSGLSMLLRDSGFMVDDDGLSRILGQVKSEERLELAEPREIRRYFERCGATPGRAAAGCRRACIRRSCFAPAAE